MASVYDKVGQAGAKADLAVAKACGQVIGFTHRDGWPMALHAQIVTREQTSETPQRGRLVERSEVKFLVPEQAALSGYSGFSGSVNTEWFSSYSGIARPVTEGDEIQFPIENGKKFWVDKNVIEIHNGHGWIIKGTAERTLTAGPGG